MLSLHQKFCHQTGFSPLAGLLCLIAMVVMPCTGQTAQPVQPAQSEQAVQFNQHIRPILADACLHCHGQDSGTREADLRLDDRASAIEDRGGYSVILPGKAAESELIKRITTEDEYMQMPPVDSHRQLTSEEVELLKTWIEQGATYEKHWAFLPVEQPAVPESDSAWIQNEIDAFVLDRLKEEGLEPQQEADLHALIRRLSLDLTGLPPTPEQVDQFVNDKAAQAYERLVDRLLDSPQYGERMAAVWLDLARYADSGGYQGDIPRTMWPWRDWVIRAYNSNMPFDQFTTEQLAGDLLPNPTPDQLIATGFNRNHRINDEDGIIPEEFRNEYVVDRVETTSLTWMGLTLGCARCHDHKFDPLSQANFYAFSAYFNSVDEYGRGYGNTQPLYYFDESVRERIEAIDSELIALGDAAQGEYQKLIDLKNERDEILSKSLTTMIMRDLPEPRETYLLERGQYDKRGRVVEHGVPEEILPLSKHHASNRLGLAKWLTRPATSADLAGGR